MSLLSFTSDCSWLGHFQLQKTIFSGCDQITLVSGDGFNIPFPAPLLLASSSLLRGIYQESVRGQVICLPSVRGDTLLLVVELLRRGSTGGILGVENTGQRLKEVQGVMDVLQTGVNVALKTVTSVFEDELQGNNTSGRKKKHTNIIGTFSNFDPATSLNMNPNPLYNSPGPLDSSDIKIEPLEIVETNLSESASQENDVTNISLDEYEPTSVEPFTIKSENKNSFREQHNFCEIADELSDVSAQNLGASCHVCEKVFTNKLSMRKHVRNQHPEMTFSCNICESSFILESTFKKHMKIAHEDIRFNCSLCPCNFSCKKNLIRHMRNKHGKSNEMQLDNGENTMLEPQLVTFPCSKCDFEFKCKDSMGKHLQAAHEKPTVTEDEFIKDENTNFQKDKKIIHCTHCIKQFSSKHNMMRHVVTIHEGQRIACGECNFKSLKKERVVQHCIESLHDLSSIKTVYM